MFTSFKNWHEGTTATFLILLLGMPGFAQFHQVQSIYTTGTGLPSGSVRALKVDRLHRLWVGTDNGLSILHESSNNSKELIKSIGASSIWSIASDDSLIYIATRFSGLYVVDPIKFKILQHFTGEEIPSIRRIRILNNRLFIATERGLYELKRGQLLRLDRNLKDVEFVIDLFLWKKEIFAVGYNHTNILRVGIDGILTDATKEFLFDQKASENYDQNNKMHLIPSFFTSISDSNNYYLGSDAYFGGLLKGGVFNKHIYNTINNPDATSYIHWDLLQVADRVVAAIGDTWTNEKGYLAFYDFNNRSVNLLPTPYLNCIEYDSVADVLYAGTKGAGVLEFPKIRNWICTTNDAKNSIWTMKPEIVQSSTRMFNNQYDVTLDALISKNWDASNRSFSFSSKFASRPAAFVKTALPYNGEMYFFESFGLAYRGQLMDKKIILEPKGVSFLPQPLIGTSGILLINREKNIRLINTNSSLDIKIPDSILLFGKDYAVESDTLSILYKDSILQYYLDVNKSSLQFKKSFYIGSQVQSFDPLWLLTKGGAIWLLNKNTIIELNGQTGAPTHALGFGSLNLSEKPTINDDGLHLYFDYLYQLLPVPLGSSKGLKNGIELELPTYLNEGVPFKINLISSDINRDRGALIKLEIWKGQVKVGVYYSIASSIELPKGLDYGDYRLVLNREGQEVEKYFTVHLPWIRNPFVLATISILFIALFFLFGYHLNRKRKMELELNRKKMQLLRQNFNPHFVYNTMNLITSIVLEGKQEEAVQVIAEFSRLQRSYLEKSERAFISLAEELELLKGYLHLQQQRFKYDRPFVYTINVDNSVDPKDWDVPALILQPLVENAIKYAGVDQEENCPVINIEVIMESQLRICIKNKYSDRLRSNSGVGVGLKIVVERIQLANKSSSIKYDFDTKDRDGFFSAEVKLKKGP